MLGTQEAGGLTPTAPSGPHGRKGCSALLLAVSGSIRGSVGGGGTVQGGSTSPQCRDHQDSSPAPHPHPSPGPWCPKLPDGWLGRRVLAGGGVSPLRQPLLLGQQRCPHPTGCPHGAWCFRELLGARGPGALSLCSISVGRGPRLGPGSPFLALCS